MRTLRTATWGILLLALLVAGCAPVDARPPTRGTETRTPEPDFSATQAVLQQGTRTAEAASLLEDTAAVGTQAAQASTQAALGTRQAAMARAAQRATQQAVEATATGQAQISPTASATIAPATQPASPLSKLSTADSQEEDEPPPASFEEILAADFQSCTAGGEGRQKIRVENRTGEVAGLYLFGPENYACSIDAGVQRIYIKDGKYDISSVMCGGQMFDFGSNVINPTWYIVLKCP